MSKLSNTSDNQSNKKLIICFFGIFFAYFLFGIIQEWITRTEYGELKERFTFTYCLVFFQCIANSIFSKLVLSYEKTKNDGSNKWLYPVCALTYLGAMLASNEALQHVSYPTQVLGKSVKPVPVMIFGVLIAHKRYHKAKYLAVLMIVLGIVLFMYKDKKTKPLDDPLPNHPFALIGFGELLLIVSLAMDGLTGAIQDRINGSHNRTNPHTMMYLMNIWSCFYLFFTIILTGEIFEFALFMQKFPNVVVKLILLSILGCIGQHFIFTTITNFGPLKCSIITTTRKFFTILGSVIIFSNPMSSRQWLGSVLVFIGLALDSKYGKEIKQKN